MNRDICKANLKKLRLCGGTPTEHANCSSTRKTLSSNAGLSKYFYTPLSSETEYPIHNDYKQEIEVNVGRWHAPPAKSKDFGQEHEESDNFTTEKLGSEKESFLTKKTRKCTKLKEFVLREGTNTPQHNKTKCMIENHTAGLKQCEKLPLNEVKKVNKNKRGRCSSIMKPSRSKNRQPDIKSSLLRGERMFCKITAQHCRVDNFSADEVQLALALSKSEVEITGKNEGLTIQQNTKQNNEHDNVPNIKNMLQQYGFCTSAQDYNTLTPEFTSRSNQKSKLKWTSKFTALTLRESKQQRKIINSRINSLMGKQLVCKLPGVYKDDFDTYSMISTVLRELKATTDFSRKLENEYSTGLQDFYVQDLFEVSHVPTGYLLKDWHKIQGRDRSPERDKQSQIKGIEISSQMELYKTGTIGINNKSSVKNQKTQGIEKNAFGSSADDYFCPSPIVRFYESFTTVEHNTKKYIHNVKLNEEIEDSKSRASGNQPTDTLSGNAFNRNEMKLNPSEAIQLIPESFSNGVRIRTQSPNIFDSSEDESDEVVSIKTLDAFKNIANPVISHDSDLTTNFFMERSNTTKDSSSIFIEDAKVGNYQQNETSRNNNIATYNRSVANINIVAKQWNAFDDMNSGNNPKLATFNRRKTIPFEGIKKRSTEFEFNDFQPGLVLSNDDINYSIRKADISRSKTLSRNHEEKYEKYFTDNSNEFPMRDLVERTSTLETNIYESADLKIISHASERIKGNCSLSHASITDKSIELLEFGIVDNISESLTQTPQMPKYHNKLMESSISIQNAAFGLDKLITSHICLDNRKNTLMVPKTNSSPLHKLQLSQSLPNEYEVDGRIYMTRMVKEPNPGLKHQTEAEILKQLFGFGIKPLKRKQAVKMLEHIYNSTHPFMLSNCLIDQEFDCNIAQQPIAIPSSSNKLQLVDFSGTELLRFTKELQTDLENEEYVFQTNVTKKTIRPLLPLHIAWFNIISTNRALHEQILMYEPVDLHEIHDFFKKIGHRFEPKDMKVFLDSRSIIFRYDMTQAGRQSERHIRKNKKKPKLKQIL